MKFLFSLFLFLFLFLLLPLCVPVQAQPSPANVYAVDPNAYSYCMARGVTNYAAMKQLDGFVRGLKLVGVWNDMVDIIILRSNLNSGNLTNALTWNGRTPNIYGSTTPLYDLNGVRFGGTGQALWITNLTDCRTNTVFVDGSFNLADVSNPASDAPAMLTMQSGDNSGSFNANQSALFLAAHTANAGPVPKQYENQGGWNPPAWSDHHQAAGLGGQVVRMSDFPRIYVFSYSNTTEQGWMENIPAGIGNTNTILSPNPVAFGTPVTNMIIGGSCSGSSPIFTSQPVTVSTVIVFRRVLTQREVDGVNRAMRWLDSRTKNIVVYGESRGAGESFGVSELVDQRGSFFNNLFSRGGFQSARLYNFSAPGINVYQQTAATNFDRTIKFYAPGGPVTETEVFYWPGALNQQAHINETVLTTWAAASNVMVRIRQTGAKLNVITEAPQTTLSYTTNDFAGNLTNALQQFNVLMVTNWGLYDRCLRYDLALSDIERVTNATASVNYYFDGAHPNTNGNFRIANYFQRQLSGESGNSYGIRGGTTNLTAATAITVAFRIPFPSTNYTVSSSGSAAIVSPLISSKTASSFVMSFTAFTGQLDWQAQLQSQ